MFPTDKPWNADVSNYCVDPNSHAYVATISQEKQYLHVDFGSAFEVVVTGTIQTN
jgi:hypothetical protein